MRSCKGLQPRQNPNHKSKVESKQQGWRDMVIHWYTQTTFNTIRIIHAIPLIATATFIDHPQLVYIMLSEHPATGIPRFWISSLPIPASSPSTLSLQANGLPHGMHVLRTRYWSMLKRTHTHKQTRIIIILYIDSHIHTQKKQVGVSFPGFLLFVELSAFSREIKFFWPCFVYESLTSQQEASQEAPEMPVVTKAIWALIEAAWLSDQLEWWV